MRKIRCPICEEKTYFKDRGSLIIHIEKSHRDNIPEGWEPSRYENFLRTGKKVGSCMVCKGETGWNSSTKKYYRICTKSSCKKTLADKAEQNMIKKTGMTKSERMKQASVQTKMIYGKRTSGCYKVGNHEIWYDSSYGKDFLTMVDDFLHLDMTDISGPSTNTYQYMYEGEKHMYIPDFIIHSLGLEIEIKDGGDNPNNHPKIQRVDKKKEEQKDKVMEALQKEGKLSYIKIVNKNYANFFKVLMELREKYDGSSPNVGNSGTNTPKEFTDIVNESVTITELPDILAISKKASGKTSSYRQIPLFFLEKIKKSKPSDIAFWEERISSTITQLKAKKRSDKSYELEETIKEMELSVIPALERRIKILQKKEERDEYKIFPTKN